MYYVCLSSFWIVSEGHFTWLHGLSAFTLITVTLGLISAIRDNIPAHRGNMIGTHIGTGIAFGFAVGEPSRSIPELLSVDPATGAFVAALVLLGVGVASLSLLRGIRCVRADALTTPHAQNRTRRRDPSTPIEVLS